MCVYCMRDVCYAGRYAQCYAQAGMVCYAGICALCNVRYAGRAGGTECVCKVCAMQICTNRQVCAMQQAKPAKRMRNSIKRAENRGIVDILYEGFRKCFVNCKFTFYITLSSYYKKVKISKTRKNHSKM